MKHRGISRAASLFVAIAALALVFSSCAQTPASKAPTASSAKLYSAGSYTAVAQGMGGDVKVQVTFSATAIRSIKVLSHNETPGVGDVAVKTLPGKIVAGQSLNVDGVAGATISSKAIFAAVEECVKKAGGDVAALKAKKVTAEAKAADLVQTADVVVIGAGGAGLAAAITANQAGSSVIVIEKMPKVGGNTIISGAAYNSADPERQAKTAAAAGPEATVMALINAKPASDLHAQMQAQLKKEYEDYKASGSTSLFDSPTLHALQTYEGGDRVGDLVLIKNFTANTLSGVKWLESLGMKFGDSCFTVLGALWQRSHKPVKPLGTGYIDAYMAYLAAHNVPILLETKANKIIMKDGKAVGVEATGPTGNKVTLYAKKGVVLATGGFARNIEMRQKYNKHWKTLDASIPSTNHPGATGDGIIMAQAVNADLVGMEWIQLLPMGDPKTGSLSGNIEQGVEDRIFVNKQGNRFVDEGARRDVMTQALYEQDGATMWVILDKHSYPTGDTKNNFNETIDELVAAGRAFKADTIEELAAKIGVPPANLAKAVTDFNAAVDKKGGDAFNRTLFADKIDTPPFYAGARVPTVHHTMGGVKVNVEDQVIDVNGAIIPGLYAAGEVTGGLHGSNRLGGNALADTVVNGRIAGANAAAGK
jgi:urocanate reductase